MFVRQHFLIFSILLLALTAVTSCETRKEGKDEAFGQVLVINELMASNHTGLMAENDSLYDWIEIKNISSSTVDLHKYALATVENKRKEKDTADVWDTNKWRMPEMQLEPGEILLVFASKRDRKEAGKELHTDFKLPKKDGCVQVLTKDGAIMSEVKYDKLAADQSFRRLEDDTYEASYYQSPGFENTQDGYEQYCQLIENQRKSPLKLWEVHTKSGKNMEAWVELKNVSDAPINLNDYALAAEPYKGKEFVLPEKTLAPGAILEVDCKKSSIDIKGSRSIALMKGGQFMDGVCAKLPPITATMGRMDGKSGFFFFPNATKGTENVGQHFRFMAAEPSFSEKPGIHKVAGGMHLEIDTHGQRVHFTKDGSLPTDSSPLYTEPIRIDTTTVIRAFCEGDSVSMRSNVATATYFINVDHTIPVVNISVNSNELFDKTTGIYEPGPGGGGDYPHKGANYWKKVHKKAHVEYYDSVGNFSLDCGFAIFGGFSRTLAKKSFKVKFDDLYGDNELSYDVFDEGKARKFKNLVFRSGSQDMSGVMVRDEFFTSLLKENSPTLLVQAYRPVALYINAKYFGLYYIREKIDKNFVADHLDVPNDSINIIMSLVYNEEGPKTHFQSLLNYVRTNDLRSKEAYDYMKNLVDFDGLIDQKLGQIYSANMDVGNIRYVRSTSEESDKKWYFVYYDVDLSWVQNPPSAFFLRAGGPAGGNETHNIIIDRLLANKDFRQRFLERLSLHMHKTFSTENTTRVFYDLVNWIKPEMKLNCKRWPEFCSFEKWEKNCETFSAKFKTRNKTVLDDLRQELKVTPEENKKYFGDLGF